MYSVAVPLPSPPSPHSAVHSDGGQFGDRRRTTRKRDDQDDAAQRRPTALLYVQYKAYVPVHYYIILFGREHVEHNVHSIVEYNTIIIWTLISI